MLKLTFRVAQILILFFCGVNGVNGDSSRKPEVNQLYFNTEPGAAYFGYSCKAVASRGDYLTWYQIKRSKIVILQRAQRTERGTGELKVKIALTLQESDNGTQVYCSKERRLPGGYMSEGIDSDLVPIMIKNRKLKPLEKPYVNAMPRTSPRYFNVGETLKFYCNGSKPVDGRKLMWYIKDKSKDVWYLDNQIVNETENVNYLDLHLNKFHHQKELFCVQAFRMSTFDNEKLGYRLYNENAKSNVIKLLLKTNNEKSRISNEEDSNEEDNRNEVKQDGVIGEYDRLGGSTIEPPDIPKDEPNYVIPLVTTLAVVVLILMLAAGIWLKRRRKNNLPTPEAEKTQENEESLYATAQVSYVELDFKQSTGHHVSTPQETSPYTQVIGVYTPNNKRK